MYGKTEKDREVMVKLRKEWLEQIIDIGREKETYINK